MYGIGLTLQVLGSVVILFTTVSLLVLGVSSLVQLSREDFIAGLFCSVKKTLAMGVPLAQLIFGGHANLGLILLPIMFYHPFQLFVCGLLANRFASQASETAQNLEGARPRALRTFAKNDGSRGRDPSPCRNRKLLTTKG